MSTRTLMLWTVAAGVVLFVLRMLWDYPAETLLILFLGSAFGFPLIWLLLGTARTFWPSRFPWPWNRRFPR